MLLNVRPLSHEGVKTIAGARKRVELLNGPSHHAGLTTIPPLSLRVGSARPKDSLCPWDHDQTTGETNCCIVEATSENILDQNTRFFFEDETF